MENKAEDILRQIYKDFKEIGTYQFPETYQMLTEYFENKESIPVELPVGREIYDKLLYYCWCVRFEKDEDFMLTKTHDAYKEFLTQTETHDGDCTLQAISCMRCHLQACEIEAQKLYNYLYGK